MEKKTITFNFEKPKMKTVRIRNNQIQSVRVVYNETEEVVEINIHPRIAYDRDNQPIGELIGPGDSLEVSEP